MGITVSPASSSGGGGGSSGTLPVIPGTAVTREIYTDTGFTTGDYVYRYGNGSVGSAPNSGTINAINYGLYSTSSLTFSTIGGLPVSLNRASVVAPQSIAALTYSGTSVTYGGVNQAEQTIRAENSSQGPRIARLSNGNFVAVFNGNTTSGTAQTLYYRIFQNDNTQVATGTIATNFSLNASTNGANYDVCPTAAGGFAVVYLVGSSPSVAVYSSTGSVVTSPTAISTGGGSTNFYPRIRQYPSSGDFYVSGSDSATSGYNCEISRLNSSLVYQSYYAIGAGSYASVGPLNFEFFPNNNGNLLVAFVYGPGGNTVRYQLLTNNLGNIGGGSFGSGSTSPDISIVPLANGNMMTFNLESSNARLAYFTTTSISTNAQVACSGSGSLNPAFAVPYTGPVDASFSSSTQLSLAAYFFNTSNAQFVTRIFNYNASTSTYTASAANVNTGINASLSRVAVVQSTTAANAVAYTVSNGQPKYILSSTAALANGATVTVQSSQQPTPANGYYLLGVATTTAAAGTTGTIAINGKVNLSASYGTSATPIGFDYNPRNVAGLPNGNKGYVVNRVVTLTGLE